MSPRLWLLVLLVSAGCGPVKPPEPGTVASVGDSLDHGEDLLDNARRLANEGKTEQAMQFAEQALARSPEDPESLQTTTALLLLHCRQLIQEDRAAANQLFYRAGELARRLQKVKPTLDPGEQNLVNGAFYNEACAHAVEGRDAKALQALEAALDAGYRHLDDIDTDADWTNLRDNDRYQALLQRARGRLAEASRQEAEEDLHNFQSFPFTFALPNLAGDTVSLDDYRGKVLIVDIWGTWCPPCRREIPHFIALYRDRREQGLEIVGLNYETVDRSQWRETIERFIDEVKIPYPCLLGDEPTLDRIPGFEVYPTTLFIDRSGKVRLKAEGYHEKAYLEAVADRLLSESVEDAKSGGVR